MKQSLELSKMGLTAMMELQFTNGGDTVNIYHDKLPDLNKPVQLVKDVAHGVSDFFRGVWDGIVH